MKTKRFFILILVFALLFSSIVIFVLQENFFSKDYSNDTCYDIIDTCYDIIELSAVYRDEFIPYNYSYNTTVKQIVNDYNLPISEEHISNILLTGTGELDVGKNAMINNYETYIEYEFLDGKLCGVLYNVQIPQENFDEGANFIYEELKLLFSDYYESSHGNIEEMSVINPFSCKWVSGASKLFYIISFDSIDANKSLTIYITNSNDIN